MSYAALSILRQLYREDMDWILDNSELKTLLANSILVREGAPSDAIYFVSDGLFEVYVYSDSRSQTKINQLGPGEVIGEVSWLDGMPISASVRAIESSSVIVLPTSALERKFAQDTGFAARLLRGVGTIAAQRLRRLTSHVQRSQRLSSGVLEIGSSDTEDIFARLTKFKLLAAAVDKRAFENKGVVPEADANELQRAFDELDRVLSCDAARLAPVADLVQAELVPFIQLTETGGRYYTKPRGYAGDYLTIEMIYNNRPSGVGRIGPVLDKCMLNLAAARAVRNRRNLLTGEILSTAKASTKDHVYITSLACGPAREIFDVFDRINHKKQLIVSCVDIDREALALLESRAHQKELSEQVRAYHGNLIYLATGRQELHHEPQDLVYSIGLIDYFNDEFVVKLLDWVHDRLRPGGKAILGNFHPRNPTKSLMDHVLDWRLIHRTEADMDRLFQASKFKQPCGRILFEEERINLFAECARRD